MSIDRRPVVASVGDFSLAGVQTKFTARFTYILMCDPELGGCDWAASGEVDGDYFVQSVVIRPGVKISE